MFEIFKRKKKMTIKELYAPVLDEMWMCAFNFTPWDPEDFRVTVKKVRIISAQANLGGIWVMSDETIPGWQTKKYEGYIDKITASVEWVGFFETKEQAETEFNKMMDKWISEMESRKFGKGTGNDKAGSEQKDC
jgi:hypothetical protein